MEFVKVKPPEVLRFPLTYSDRPESQPLLLENVGEGEVAFKIKTTAPKSYSVRPNTGVIPGHGIKEVTITLHAMQSAPSGNHKFSVQAMKLDDGETAESVDWATAQKMKGKVQDSRLNVEFLEEANMSDRPHMADLDGKVDVPKNGVTDAVQKLTSCCLALEKRRAMLFADQTKLEQELKEKQNKDSNEPSSSDKSGETGQMFELWHIIAFIIAVAVVARLMKLITQMIK